MKPNCPLFLIFFLASSMLMPKIALASETPEATEDSAFQEETDYKSSDSDSSNSSALEASDSSHAASDTTGSEFEGIEDPSESETKKPSAAKSSATTPSARKAARTVPVASQPPNQEKASDAVESATNEAPETQPTTEIVDGSVVEIKELGIKIRPPAGWTTKLNVSGMTLIMEESNQGTNKLVRHENDAATNELKTSFTRNITLVTLHGASPIDEKEAKLFKERITKDFSKAAGITEFAIDEKQSFFDYKGKNDGIILYSHFKMYDIQLSQMHMIVSGEANRFLLSYTDLSSSLQNDKSAFENAWQAMSSLEVSGVAPDRFENAKIYGLIAGALSLLLLVVLVLRKKRQNLNYGDFNIESQESADDLEPLKSGVWNLYENEIEYEECEIDLKSGVSGIY